MKNVIKDLAASNAVSWGGIAEKIDENFSELEENSADKKYVKNAIAEAITTALNTEV